MNDEFDPTDPNVMKIAQAFLRGFQAELRNQEEIIRRLESDDNRRLLPRLGPQVARQYEEHTKEELESNKPYVAISVGVASAILFAMKANKPEAS